MPAVSVLSTFYGLKNTVFCNSYISICPFQPKCNKTNKYIYKSQILHVLM